MPQDYKPIAQAIISRHTSSFWGVNTETLGKDLSGQCLSYMLAVCQVFDNLSSLYDRTWTGFYMIKNLPDATLLRIARYKESNALLSSVSDWIGRNMLTQGGKWVREFKSCKKESTQLVAKREL